MKFAVIPLFILFLIGCTTTKEVTFLKKEIDGVLTDTTRKPFNGVVLISKNNKSIYQKALGFADLELKTPLRLESEFMVGSISKQITAVLILQAYEKGKIQLHVPIKKYLPALSQSWADSVTVHYLLTHTHGITNLETPLSFPVGSAYAYSQLGYQLLADIVSEVEQKTFVELSTDLFKKSKLNSTYHPDYKIDTLLVKSYTEDNNGKLLKEKVKVQYVAAGGFISNVIDLQRWNALLYKGHLLKKDTYQQMITKQPNALRNHPTFGKTAYGYGVTIDAKEQVLQLGLTGYVPGFASMNFYFPDSNLSVIVLQNVAYDLDDFKKTFGYQLAILNAVRASELIKKSK